MHVRVAIDGSPHTIEGVFAIDALPVILIHTRTQQVRALVDRVDVVAVLLSNGKEIDVRGMTAMEIHYASRERWLKNEQKPSMYRGTFADVPVSNESALDAALNARLHKKDKRQVG